ncbi:MAG: hypothetical protein PHS73_04835, partial [Candidatus Peribacteraceae bacterium]|nr:hypothetical protein [Candidatus Peribacteraceae bacterium]
RSVHTVVYPLPGVTEQPMEIQIRTEEMHRTCEFGLAAHGEYKNLLYSLDAGTSRVHLLRNLASLREEARSPERFEETLRHYFRDDHLAVFDAENHLYHLKGPVTALDFVATAHPKRLPFLKTIRVNGRERPFGTLLRSGDTVEAFFGRARSVSCVWFSACRLRGTKAGIRAVLQ